MQAQFNSSDDSLSSRGRDVYRSFRTLPGWVQLWVMGVLFPVNIAAVLLWIGTGHPVAGWTGAAALFVGAVNGVVVLVQRGTSKLMSIPHLPVWIPAQIYTVVWLLGDAPMSAALTVFAAIYAVTIGVSNVFDVIDTWRWLKGDRAVPGAGPS